MSEGVPEMIPLLSPLLSLIFVLILVLALITFCCWLRAGLLREIWEAIRS